MFPKSGDFDYKRVLYSLRSLSMQSQPGPFCRQEIRAVIFDAVGTLLHPEPGAVQIYSETARRHGSRLDTNQIASSFRTAFAQQELLDRQAGWRTSEEREFDRWRTIVAEVLVDVNDSDACFHELYDHFSRPTSWRAELRITQALESLADRGIVLGIASNFDTRLRQVLAGMPWRATLEHVLISSEVGWRKPGHEFFEVMSRTIAVPACNILYVGDDPVNDIEGARNAGLQAALFDAQEFNGLESLLRLRP